jgi:transcriptional regulator with XRE-family HTH domain
MTVEYLSFNELLRLYRERKGLNQQQLAHKLGIDASLLSKWETVLRIPILVKVKKLHFALS